MKHISRHYCDSLSLLSTESGQAFYQLLYPYLTHPAVLRLAEYRHHGGSRLDHATSVAYLTYIACRTCGEHCEDVVAAALLHDLFYFDREHGNAPRFPWIRHPQEALRNAEELFPLSPAAKDIILRHMFPLTGKLPRTREGRLVSRLDKYCAVREFLRAANPFSNSRRKRKEC